MLLLALLPVVALASSIPDRQDFLVEGLEEIEPAFSAFEGSMFAGLLPVNEYPIGEKATNSKHSADEGEYMFWLFQPDVLPVDDSVVVWFNGGPGCSSFHAGLFFENGPVTNPLHPAGFFTPPEEVDGPFIKNEYSWTRMTTMLYVEQPVPVGFSHGGKEPVNETDVGRYFYGFLQNFMNVFPEQRSKRLYLVGESYAGMYIPSVGIYVHEMNKQLQATTPERQLNLNGIAIGNGWVDARIQGPLVIDFAWYHGMIDTVTRDAFKAEWDHCKKHIYDSRDTTDTEPAPFHRFTVPDECGIMGALLDAAGAGLLHRGSPNTYDVTTWDPYDVLNANNNPAFRFFNNPKVQDILHVDVDDEVWMGCIPGAGRRRLYSSEAMQGNRTRRTNVTAHSPKYHSSPDRLRRNLLLLDDDRPISTAPYIAELLDDAGIDVLVYNGDRDMSTCSQGSELVLNEMNWSGQKDWLDPDFYDRGLWLVDGEMSGYTKVVDNLQFLVVYNSGHLVPYNRPRISLDLVRRIVKSKTFMDKKIPVVFKVAQASDEDEDKDTKSKIGFSSDSNLEETLILVFISFAFGYATSVVLSKLHIHCFGKDNGTYERIPNQTAAERQRLAASTRFG